MTEDLIAMEPQPGTLGEMLRDSGLFAYMSESDLSHMHCVLRLAALIEARAVARTREECAKAIDKRGLSKDEQDCPSAVNGWWPDQVLFRCAQAIRALGERT